MRCGNLVEPLIDQFPIFAAIPVNYESLGHLKGHKDYMQSSADADQPDEPMSDEEQVMFLFLFLAVFFRIIFRRKKKRF